jgi:predicted chitinase
MLEAAGPASPYPGLRPFNSDEADIFFGRESHTDRLLEILQRERFLAVIGPSGSGKSSLVRAGLLPSLKMGSLGSGSNWRIAIMRPGNQPIRSLTAALLRHDIFGSDVSPDNRVQAATEDAAMVEAELRRGPLGLLHATEDARAAAGAAASDVNLLVVVDQFEEIFTYAEAGDEHADESDLFVSLLLEARADPSSRIHVVLTMRTDFLGNCVRFPALPDAINRAQYLTPRLTRAEMESAIEGPAEVAGGSVERSLVTELINATRQNSDQLPLLQHALSRMWPLAIARDSDARAIGWDDARRVGGLSGALDQHAEDILAQLLSTTGQGTAPLVEGLFAAVTERRAAAGGGQDVRRPQQLSRIAQPCNLGDNWQALVPIVQAYAAPGASLLQHGHELNGESVIDLAHEALMRQWTRLSGWVDAESRRRNEYLRWVERAREHAEERGPLLEGAALLRASEWLNGDEKLGVQRWRPSAAWAARYTPDNVTATFGRTVDFIEKSVAAAGKREEEERAAIAREREAAVERAKAAETAARRAMKTMLLAVGAAVLFLALLGMTAYFALESRRAASNEKRAAERAAAAEAQAQYEQARAEDAVRRLEAQAATASPPASASGGSPDSALPAGSTKPVLSSSGRAVSSSSGRARSSGPATALPEQAFPAPAPAPVPPPAPPPAQQAPVSPSRTITADQLAAIMPNSTAQNRAAFLKPLNDAMAEWGIDTPLRMAHFLGQLSFEGGDLRYLQERWGPTESQKRYEPPNGLGVRLGNTEPGDGQRYLGRGIIQIVGRGNYKKFGDLLKLDLVGHPELAARPEGASRIAAAFWNKTGLNALADQDDIREITRRINGGLLGLESRTLAVQRAKAVLLPAGSAYR